MGLVVFLENWKNPNEVIEKPNSSSRWVAGKANILPEKPVLASRRWTERHTEEGQRRCLAGAGRWRLAVPGSELWRSALTLHSAHAHSRTLQRLYTEHNPVGNHHVRITHREWSQGRQDGGKVITQLPNYSVPHCRGSIWRRCFLPIINLIGRIWWYHVTSHKNGGFPSV